MPFPFISLELYRLYERVYAGLVPFVDAIIAAELASLEANSIAMQAY
jgi:hypothetical protein